MKRQLVNCMKKDFKEYIRTKKNLLFVFTILAVCAFVLGTTLFLPGLIAFLSKTIPDSSQIPETLLNTLQTLFPNQLRENLGILSADIVVFYSLVVVLSCYTIIPQERAAGKWIIPVGIGYKPSALVLSKGFIYGFCAIFPVITFYMLYYCIGSIFLIPNLAFQTAIINAFVLSFAIFSVVYLSITLSAVSKHPATVAATVIVVIITIPDILSLFSFGTLFPTYILSFTYAVSNNFSQLIIPIITTFLLLIVSSIYAMTKSRISLCLQ